MVSGSYSSVVFSRLKEVGNNLVVQARRARLNARGARSSLNSPLLSLQMRPWGEILDRQSYSKPTDLSEVRMRR